MGNLAKQAESQTPLEKERFDRVLTLDSVTESTRRNNTRGRIHEGIPTGYGYTPYWTLVGSSSKYHLVKARLKKTLVYTNAVTGKRLMIDEGTLVLIPVTEIAVTGVKAYYAHFMGVQHARKVNPIPTILWECVASGRGGECRGYSIEGCITNGFDNLLLNLTADKMNGLNVRVPVEDSVGIRKVTIKAKYLQGREGIALMRSMEEIENAREVLVVALGMLEEKESSGVFSAEEAEEMRVALKSQINILDWAKGDSKVYPFATTPILDRISELVKNVNIYD